MMTDIYRQELAIPEKRRFFGWLMLLGGAVMVLVAILLFYQEASLLKKFDLRPWEQPAGQASPSPSAPISTDQQKQLFNRTQPLFWIVAMSLGLLVVFILVASLNHRLAGHLKNSLRHKKEKTTLGDPWKEAGDKFKLDSHDP